MRKDKIELLAPAGNREAFIGAINAGADAIYLSGKNYGARRFADNFTKDEIAKLIQYAHQRNVLVYVTINTLIFEDEIKELMEYSDFLVDNDVDALIVQDLGIIDVFCQRYPDTEIHASTQMNTYNASQLKFLKNLGVKRVILARETSVEDIIDFKEDLDIDLEVFIHGALCVSYSGNCLFSSFQGGRSGNRGECAQPCRLKYGLYREDELIGSEGYLLSTKDLMTFQELEKVISCGVSSLKIEGRMRRPEYVIATVRAYREAIDHIYEGKPIESEKKIRELKLVFNREYTKGFILGEEPHEINNSYRPNHQGINVGKVIGYNNGKTTISLSDTLRVGDGIRIIGTFDSGGKVDRIILDGRIVKEAHTGDIVTIDMANKIEVGSEVMKTLDSLLESSLKEYLNENYDLIGLDIKLYSYVGEKMKIELKTHTSPMISLESDYVVQKAKTPVQDESRLADQISKFGNTFYYVDHLKVFTDGLGFVPNGVINELRRKSIEVLEQASVRKPRRILESYEFTIPQGQIEPPKIVVKIENNDQYEAAKKCGIDDIYVSKKVDVNDETSYLVMDRINQGLDETYKAKHVVIRDIGSLTTSDDIDLIADATLNATNSLSLGVLFKNGVRRVCISLESSLQNTSQMIRSYQKRFGHIPELEIIVYGKPDLMITKYCPISKTIGANKKNCSLCEKNQYALVNEKQDRFILIRDGDCNIRILHSRPINLIEQIKEIHACGIKTLRLDFTDESPEETEMIIKAFIKSIQGTSFSMKKKNTLTAGSSNRLFGEPGQIYFSMTTN